MFLPESLENIICWTRILYDFGWLNGNDDIVPYLSEDVGLSPSDGLHYTVVSHRDSDHYTEFRAMVESGYDVLVSRPPPCKMYSEELFH